jgi:hypothetical protein
VGSTGCRLSTINVLGINALCHGPAGAPGTSTPNNIREQNKSKVSPLHYITSKVSRSKKQTSVAPAESPQNLRVFNFSKSTEREGSPKIEDLEKEKQEELQVKADLCIEALDKVKLEELRVKADAWENARNVTILNR